MKIIIIIGTIIAFCLYAYLMWQMGRDFKRQLLIDKELKKAKLNLKPGQLLNEKWYEIKKRSKTRRILYMIILSVFFMGLVVIGFKIDLRLQYIALNAFLVVSPAWMGYEGIIPLPGISINN